MLLHLIKTIIEWEFMGIIQLLFKHRAQAMERLDFEAEFWITFICDTVIILSVTGFLIYHKLTYKRILYGQ